MAMFNAKAARAKRPLPVWVDASKRDTQHLQADEIGAYLLILMAMWSRKSCDLPDDDSRLIQVTGVSSKLWKSRIGPVIREYLVAEDGVVFSKRLREEAAYVERHVKQQSDRRLRLNPDKPLNSLEQAQSADTSLDHPRNCPTQQPNNLKKTLIADAIRGDAPEHAADKDENKQFWVNAKAYFRKNNVSEKSAGSFIGKCLRECGLARSGEAFRAAQDAGVAEPVPWISAVLNKPAHQPAINDNVNRMLNERLGIADEELPNETDA